MEDGEIRKVFVYALEYSFGNQIENVSMFQGYHKYTGSFRQDFS